METEILEPTLEAIQELRKQYYNPSSKKINSEQYLHSIGQICCQLAAIYVRGNVLGVPNEELKDIRSNYVNLLEQKELITHLHAQYLHLKIGSEYTEIRKIS